MIEKQPRMTMQTMAVLGTMLQAPTADWYGLELATKVDLKSGTIYPILARLERFGWLSSTWEDAEPSEEKRPRRRIYKLTGEGERAAREVANELLAKVAPAGARGAAWGLKPGGQTA
jgi:PadR family transcriptional regulator, regulatory protein PadR